MNDLTEWWTEWMIERKHTVFRIAIQLHVERQQLLAGQSSFRKQGSSLLPLLLFGHHWKLFSHFRRAVKSIRMDTTEPARRVDTKELKRLKKEKKARKTEQLLKRLEQHGLLQGEAAALLQGEAAALAAKPVPKNILQKLSKESKVSIELVQVLTVTVTLRKQGKNLICITRSIFL